MRDFLYFQSLVQYRIPVNDDGTLGNPEIIRKFTSPVKGAKTYNKPRKKTHHLAVNETDSIEI